MSSSTSSSEPRAGYRLRPRTWFRLTTAAAFALLGMLVAFNLIVDPYGYFGVGPLEREVQTNERLWKIDYLSKHHERYEAFIMGSSVASQVSPVFAGELTGDRFYNFTLSGANAYDYLTLTEHMLEQDWQVRRILILFDLSSFWEYGVSPRTYEQPHPKISGASPLEFYASYLTRIHFWASVDKLRLNIDDIPPTPHTSYEQATGTYQFSHQIEQIREDEEHFLHDSKTLNENFLLRLSHEPGPFDEAMAAMTRVRDLCEREGIELTVVIPAHNYNYMNRVRWDEYRHYLGALAEIVPFWDFSGYGDVNLDNHHYYDSAHFRPSVGNRILGRVYGDTEDPGFGVRVTPRTLDDHLQAIRPGFERADRTYRNLLADETS